MNLLTQATHGPALATAGSALSIAGMFGSVRDAIHTFAPVYAELIGMAVANKTAVSLDTIMKRRPVPNVPINVFLPCWNLESRFGLCPWKSSHLSRG